jgi:membrane protease YdiL (CAAX protease family)
LRKSPHPLLVATLLILILGALKHGSDIAGTGGDVVFVVAFLFQVFVPIWLIEREGNTLAEYKIALPRQGGKLDWQAIGIDFRRVLLFSLVSLALFFAGYHALQMFFANQNGMTAHFSFALPDNFLNFSIASIAVVALSEEIFYRGYLQTQLLKRCPAVQWPVVLVFVVTNVFFALGHFIGDYHFDRLLPFFPGLLFSYLVFRSRSIFGAVLFHGLCNIFAEVLRESYFWK